MRDHAGQNWRTRAARQDGRIFRAASAKEPNYSRRINRLEMVQTLRQCAINESKNNPVMNY